MKIISLFLISSIFFSLCQSQNNMDLKFSANLEQINQILKCAIKPYFESVITKTTYTGPYEVNTKIGPAKLNLIFTNIKIAKHDINWDLINTTAIDNNKVKFNMGGITMKIENDLYLHYLTTKSQAPASLSLKNVQLSIVISLNKASSPSGFSAKIESVDFHYDSIQITLSKNKIMQNIVDELLKLKFIVRKIFTSRIKSQLGGEIQQYSEGRKPIKITFGQEHYQLLLKFERVPQISTKDNKSYLQINPTFEIKSSKGDSPKTQPSQASSEKSINNPDIELTLANSLLSKLLWVVVDSNVTKMNISDAQLPKDLQIKLNTNSLSVLLPQLQEKYGEKSIYVEVQLLKKQSKISVKGGRLISNLNLQTIIYVDQDSSQYPLKDPKKCKKCDKAVTLNINALAGFSIFTEKDIIQAQIVNFEINKLSIPQSKVKINEEEIRKLLNNMFQVFITSINEEGLKGLVDPKIKEIGIENLGLNFNENNIVGNFKFGCLKKLLKKIISIFTTKKQQKFM